MSRFISGSDFSVNLMISFIMRTDSTGYLPTAVSAESMTKSVPSMIALATSVTSARVGRVLSVMCSSICVAVMTNLPAALHLRMICFWTMGTS